MPAYLIRHKGGPSGDALIEDPHLALACTGEWAVFTDDKGASFAIPAHQVASIERIDPDSEGPALEG
ncbi:hypothetical protein [Streptomyces sp. SAJ15]|uniref:hypothetical protein n=1 Tax=Streptomyces sp. SAJ15 TaxID=2011095 RepID=UPI001186C1FB|nr:hypothetical protein [Streptomyces sp. SAJ15]TVL89751.1 hypothetical protein CD790_25480 [Streptomyces sp. SAJ15]